MTFFFWWSRRLFWDHCIFCTILAMWEKKCNFAGSKTSDMENNSAYWLDMSVTTFNIEARYQKYKEE